MSDDLLAVAVEAARAAGADVPVVYPVLAPGEDRAASVAALATLAPEA